MNSVEGLWNQYLPDIQSPEWDILNYRIMMKLYGAVSRANLQDAGNSLNPEKYHPMTGEPASFAILKKYLQELLQHTKDNDLNVTDIEKGRQFVFKPMFPGPDRKDKNKTPMSLSEAKRTFFQRLGGREVSEGALDRAFENAEFRSFLQQGSFPKPQKQFMGPKKEPKSRQGKKSDTSEE